MSEDAPIAKDGNDERQQHADDNKQNRVVVGDGAVPQAFLSLGVEPMRRPADVIRQVEGNTDHPRRKHCTDSSPASEHFAIEIVPADVDVAVGRDECDGQQRTDAADDAETGCSCTQPLTSTQQPILPHHCTFNTTPTSAIVNIFDDSRTIS